MPKRSHLLSSCLVLLVCISSVQAVTYGICDFYYNQYVATSNKSLIATVPSSTGKSLSLVLHTCGGNNDCGFVYKDNNGDMHMYNTVSYEEYNITGSPFYMYMKDASTCTDFASYKWTYGAYAYTATNKCPSTRRLTACFYQKQTSDVEADCPTADQFCCFDASASTGLKCTNSYLYSCDVPSISSEIGPATVTSPSSSGGGTNQNIVYLGEAVTVTCNQGLMFSGEWTVDSNTKTVISCVLDSAAKLTTNIVQTLNRGRCSDTCNGAYYDSSTTLVNQVFPTRKYSPISVNCKDGFGLQGGYTAESQECTTSSFTAIVNCTRCQAPTDSAGSSYDKSSTIPASSIVQTCTSGYSIEITGAKTDTKKCTVNGFESNFASCIKMCTLDLMLTGSNPHSVPNNVTELAYKSSITLSCPAGTLPLAQSSTLTCNEVGAKIKPLLCDVECVTTGSIANGFGYPKISGSAAPSKVAAGTSITVDCKTGYALWYGRTNVFQCSSTNYNVTSKKFITVPECLKSCTLEIASDVAGTLGQAKIVYGNIRNISNNDKVVQGEKVNIPCKLESYTIIKSHANEQNLSCDGTLTQLYAAKCMPPCDVTGLTGGNNNTKISPLPSVGAGAKVTFTCNSNYQLGEGDKTIESSVVTCNSSSMLQPSAIPVTSSCYGVPTMTAEGSGEKKIQTKLSLPIDYDRSKSSVDKVIFKEGSKELKTLNNVGGLSGSSASQDTLLDLTKYSNSVELTAEVYYTGVTKPKTVKESSPTGPPALTIPTNGLSIVFTGRDSFKVTATGSNTATIKNIYSSAKIRADFYEKTKKRAASAVYTMDIALNHLDGTAQSIPSGKLKQGTSYDMKLTTVVNGGEGGSLSKVISTGYDAPTVTTKVLTSTSNELTITLSSAAPQTASYVVTYTVDGTATDATVEFTNGVGTLTLTDLSAKGKYTYKISIKTSGGVSSTGQTITITQGPTEPTDLKISAYTDKSITVTWTLVAANTYNLELKSISGSTETSVGTGNTTADNFTFSSLTAGVDYKVYVAAEMTISGNQFYSGNSVVSGKTFDCDVAAKKVNFELYSQSSNTLVTDLYLNKDEAAIFNISCATGYEPDVASGATVDNTTACIGPNTWASFTDCKVESQAAKQENDSDVVVGVVLGILAVVVIIAIILILIYRRNKRKSSSARYNPSAEEKKSNEKADGGEAWRNPYYVENNEKRDKEKDQGDREGIEIDMDNIYVNEKTPESEIDNNKRGTPDIPEVEPVEYDNNIADKEDNASQEVKIEFQDNDDEGEVHENKNADANV